MRFSKKGLVSIAVALLGGLLASCGEIAERRVVVAEAPSGLDSDVALDPALGERGFSVVPEEDPNARRAAGVPAGERSGPFTVTPKGGQRDGWYGSERAFWVYTPANYKQGDRPPVMMVLDGHRLPETLQLEAVLDNLVAQGKLPPLLCIYLHTGTVKGQRDKENRRWEMMRRNTEWSDYVFGEVMPEARRRFTFDESGDWLAMGASSSVVGAFSLAWYRPDKFSRVIGYSPSFVSLRVDRADTWVDADAFKDLALASDRRDLRVYLSTGYEDLVDADGPGEEALTWARVNIEMAKALEARGHAWRFFFRADHDHGLDYGKRTLTDALLWGWAGKEW